MTHTKRFNTLLTALFTVVTMTMSATSWADDTQASSASCKSVDLKNRGAFVMDYEYTDCNGEHHSYTGMPVLQHKQFQAKIGSDVHVKIVKIWTVSGNIYHHVHNIVADDQNTTLTCTGITFTGKCHWSK